MKEIIMSIKKVDDEYEFRYINPNKDYDVSIIFDDDGIGDGDYDITIEEMVIRVMERYIQDNNK